MGLCASKDKKEKVIEGDGAATANGEPNGGTATAGSPDVAAAQEGCVYLPNGACHRSYIDHFYCLGQSLSLSVCVCVCVCVYLMLTSDCPKNLNAIKILLPWSDSGAGSKARMCVAWWEGLTGSGEAWQGWACCLLCAYSASSRQKQQRQQQQHHQYYHYIYREQPPNTHLDLAGVNVFSLRIAQLRVCFKRLLATISLPTLRRHNVQRNYSN